MALHVVLGFKRIAGALKPYPVYVGDSGAAARDSMKNGDAETERFLWLNNSPGVRKSNPNFTPSAPVAVAPVPPPAVEKPAGKKPRGKKKGEPEVPPVPPVDSAPAPAAPASGRDNGGEDIDAFTGTADDDFTRPS